jgi:hypothetical protein
MREHKLEILGHGEFIVRTPLGVDKYKDWLDDVLSHKDELLQVSKMITRLEEHVFLQAATECEKDFYYLKEDIETLEERDGQPLTEYTIVGLPAIGVNGWGNDF